MSKKSLWLLPVTFLLFLGLAPEIAQYPRLNPLSATGNPLRLILVLFVGAVPLLVLALGLLRLRPFRLKQTLATILVFLTLFLGVPVSILLAASAGPGSGMAVLHGFALSFALAGVFAFMVQEPMDYWGGDLSLVLLTLSGGVALYSLIGVPVSAVQAMRTADGAPYCLAQGARDDSPLRSLPALRNIAFDFDLRPDLTGQPDFYPNHILVVQGGERRFYYWAPGAMAFRPVTPEHPANGRLGRVCTPRAGFLWGLRPV